jgi:hypothetical protein
MVGILCFITVLMLYRRYLSALSDVPGPFWASTGRLWHTRMIMRGKQGEELLKLHQEYGRVFKSVDIAVHLF